MDCGEAAARPPPPATPAVFALSALERGASDAAVAAALGAGGLGLVLVEPEPRLLRAPRARALAHARRLLLVAPSGDDEGRAERAAREELRACGLTGDVARRAGAGAPPPATSSAACDIAAGTEAAGAGEDADPDAAGGLARDVALLAALLRRVALAVAAACDRALGGESALAAALRGGSAKARLVRYNAAEGGAAGGGAVVAGAAGVDAEAEGRRGSVRLPKRDVWQQYHFDYGLFTALTGPDVTAPSGPDSGGGGGLVVLAGAEALPRSVAIPAHCVAVQVGEAAQILSRGRLAATAHCVSRAGQPRGASRETFVLFLQPPWALALGEVLDDAKGDGEGEGAGASDGARSRARSVVLAASAAAEAQLAGVVPPLACRWAPGATTYAQLAKATTAAYFGRGGLQRPGAA